MCVCLNIYTDTYIHIYIYADRRHAHPCSNLNRVSCCIKDRSFQILLSLHRHEATTPQEGKSWVKLRVLSPEIVKYNRYTPEGRVRLRIPVVRPATTPSADTRIPASEFMLS